MGKFNVDFTGNLGKDAELVTKGDLQYVRFSVATHHYNNQTRKDSVEWVQCTAFDPKTIALAKGKHLSKGTKVAVGGRFVIKQAENDVYFDVVVSDMDIMSRSTGNTPSPDDAATEDAEGPF